MSRISTRLYNYLTYFLLSCLFFSFLLIFFFLTCFLLSCLFSFFLLVFFFLACFLLSYSFSSFLLVFFFLTCLFFSCLSYTSCRLVVDIYHRLYIRWTHIKTWKTRRKTHRIEVNTLMNSSTHLVCESNYRKYWIWKLFDTSLSDLYSDLKLNLSSDKWDII